MRRISFARKLFVGFGLTAGTSALCCQSGATPLDAAKTSQHDTSPDERASLLASAKAEPRNPIYFARLGLFEARGRNYDQAIAFYRKALAINPDLPGLRLNFGLSLFKAGRYEEAARNFDLLLRHPESESEKERLTFLMGMSNYGLMNYKAAVPFLQGAAENDPHNLTLLLTLAQSCLFSKQYPCVLDAYHRIIAQDSASAEADMLAGEALDEMHDSPGAISEFRAAVLANPKEPNVHFGLGYLLWTQLQYEEAAQEFRAELANTPDHVQAMLYLADANIKLRKQSEAKFLLERVIKESPKDSLAHLDMGVIEQEAGNNDGALREFKEAVTLAPQDVNAHLKLARMYRLAGKSSEAQNEFAKVRNLNASTRSSLINFMPSSPGAGPAPQ